MIAQSSHVQVGPIRTDYVSYRTRASLRLAGCVDHTGLLRGIPWVMIAPKYGETKKSNLQLSYHLVANGFNVLRFDHTCHVGESEGEMLNFVLPRAVEDIVASLDFLSANFGVEQVIVVANSLSARCALRAANDRRVAKLISVAGVVNLMATMTEIYREDIHAQYRQGRRWGVTDFLGFEINGDAFLETLIAEGLHDLTGTIADAKKLKVPLIYFYAERDAWVRRSEVEQVVASNPRARLVVVASAMHEVRENAQAVGQLFLEIIWSCLHETPCPSNAALKLAAPNKKILLEQNRRERDRLRCSERPTESETEFWSGYLQKYSILERSSEYQEYLNLIGRLCRPLRPGALVLDAGCGNGLFGLWLLRESWLASGDLPGGTEPIVYVGLDLTERGLTDAMAKHVNLRRPGGSGEIPGLQYSRVDFDLLDGGREGGRRLPFQDQTFDLICCSLVLSYLKQPQLLLQELNRVLRPGGVLLASSMKPHCDLSLIYRDSIVSEVTADEIEAGRNLLRAAGKIKLKEEIGRYEFFSQNELAGMVIDAGFNVSETHLSLGDQAVVVKAGK